ncbi:MAG TPA: NAD-dependent epimerase/dehydratase family protein [Kineobactrum sp.]
MDQQKYVFITGGSGYIGRNLIRRFIVDGHRVRALEHVPDPAAVVAACATLAKPGASWAIVR